MIAKFKKALGYIIYLTLGHLSFGKIGFYVRYASAKLMFDKCGTNVDLQKHSRFSKKITIGDYSGIGENCYIQGECHIGDYVMIAPEVRIWTSNHKHNDNNVPIALQGSEEDKPVKIENNVWICNRVIILPGVTIGEGSIVAAGSVCTKNVPKYCVVGGAPARILRNRKKAKKEHEK